VADVQAGWWVEFYVVVAGDQVITAPANTMALFNDATATSLTIGTDGEEVGNRVKVEFDGTGYLGIVNLAKEAVTMTIA